MCTDVCMAIPLMPVLDFRSYEPRIRTEDVRRALKLHGPSANLRTLDMRFLLHIPTSLSLSLSLSVSVSVSGSISGSVSVSGSVSAQSVHS